MTFQDVADRLQVHKTTVARLVKAGKLPAVRIGRNTPRIPAEALAAFLKAVSL